jgi:hypothetical protein
MTRAVALRSPSQRHRLRPTRRASDAIVATLPVGRMLFEPKVNTSERSTNPRHLESFALYPV